MARTERWGVRSDRCGKGVTRLSIEQTYRDVFATRTAATNSVGFSDVVSSPDRLIQRPCSSR